MKNNKPSTTALITAYGRAYHSMNESPKIFDDFLAKQLITDDEYETISNILAGSINFSDSDKARFCKDKDSVLKAVIQNQIAPISLSRSRYTEDMLKLSIKLGVKQYVILGAGFDTFAFRNPDLLNHIDVFELDHPATQKLKLDRIKITGWEIPKNLHFIPVDFSKNNFAETIKNSAFNPTKLSFYSWLGVTYYLSKGEILNTLKGISNISPNGSSLAFDYADSDIFRPKKTTKRVQTMVHAAIQNGEPMKSCYSCSKLVLDLERTGFQLYEHLTPLEINNRYFKERNDDYRAFENINFALAVKK
ncbi:class I SAM-dependent methyltransferase [Clostridium sp. MB40-C1]|uniref:class I SAM-dependent methyltransferase n=1 Tax=Clostridium sp. MB40-C1 TaxID=3070996 RepID=UPI0027E1A93E|nr:class I SAM-dependent methyltransferase [Clostridium sp. MB40-C1]WMJ81793.1 class I SAM-dependent methyltransferase [Clostridium sp. MB40-C1]